MSIYRRNDHDPESDDPPESLRDALLAMAREAEFFREELKTANANFDRAHNAPAHNSPILEAAQRAEKEEAWAKQRLAGATLAAAEVAAWIHRQLAAS